MGLGEQLRKAMERLRNSSVLDQQTVKETVKDIQRALISSDVEVNLVLELSRKIEESAFKDLPSRINRREHLIKTTYDLLAEVLGGTPKVPENPERILMVGLFGSGKTTSIGKIARWYAKRGKKVGVIAADTFRPAAFEQLQQVAATARAEFFGMRGEKNAAVVAEKGVKQFKGFDLVVCDSAGRNALDEALTKEIKEIGNAFKPTNTWLVIGADMGQTAKKQAKAFHEAVGVNGIIITRIDGSAKGGGVLAACHETKAPVLFLGTGEKPDDLQAFDAQRYLSRIMGYGDLQSLLEKAKEVQEEEELDLEGLMEENFTLKTFYKQLKAARKMGPLSKVMDMMGLGAQLPKEMLEVGEEKLDGFKVMIDSMTEEERNDPEKFNRSRIARVAKGAGKTQQEVRELLKQYKNMAKVFKQFKGIDQKKLEKGGVQGLLKKFRGFEKKRKLKLR